MGNAESEQIHPTKDKALSLLAGIQGAIGDFVRKFPGTQVSDETDWLKAWFRERTDKYYTKTLSSTEEVEIPDPLPLPTQEEVLPKHIRFVSLQPHYFRGFRETADAIRLDGNLVVIDGRNTSGKTSFAEAIEWLFTGCLSRRESMELGSPHELENCISNQLRPEGDETWVSGTFVSLETGNPEYFTLRRVLNEDYGITQTSRCTSTLFLNDQELVTDAENVVLDGLFASVPPIIMQHTLRLFVESTPKERRQYFERLLHLEELTSLITKSVITDERLGEFPSPTGSVAIKNWESLAATVNSAPSKRICSQIIKSEDDDIITRITNSLVALSHIEFSDLVKELTQIEEIEATLASEQTKFKQTAFPLLEQLKPQRLIPIDQQQISFNVEEMSEVSTKVREAYELYEKAEQASVPIGSNNITISRALKILIEGHIVERDKETQTCPICNYKEANTLDSSRIKEIEGWIPIQEAKDKAEQSLRQAIGSLRGVIQKAIQEYDQLLPKIPADAIIREGLREASQELRQSVQTLLSVNTHNNEQLGQIESQARSLLSKPPALPLNKEECESFIAQGNLIINGLMNVLPAAHRYRDAFRAVEATVGVEARSDPAYRLREVWLSCFNNRAAIGADLHWERAKRHGQKDLKDIRDILMIYRDNFLESRRISFNQGIDSVWTTLRGDRYSRFSKLHIPSPSGRGYPVEIEIKAVLNDGNQEKEVDALKVFSESQVNALGIAAFITRSKLLGHKTLVLDDPVQSMDEEHFRTFAQNVIPSLLDDGFQVIVLTHNDMFARDVSNYHFDRSEYVTMSIQHSRRTGCNVEEGNRRFSERLRLAEKKIDDGDFPNSWRLLRLSLERLYTVVMIKHGPADFNPTSWMDQNAEYMWNSGAGNIVEEKVPGSGVRLKDILTMTAAGSHYKAPRGETDLRHAIVYLKSLPRILEVGG